MNLFFVIKKVGIFLDSKLNFEGHKNSPYKQIKN